MSPLIPDEILMICQNYNAWIVGSCAAPDTDLSSIRDIDIIVSYEDWDCAKLIIPLDAKMNSFRGVKFNLKDVEIDMWTQDVGRFILRGFGNYIWNPAKNIRLEIKREIIK